MKLLRPFLILLTLIASPVSAEEPKPLGVPLGAPLAEVRSALGGRPFRDNGINQYSSGPMYMIDGQGLGVEDLQSVLLIFDANSRLAALRMTMAGGGIEKKTFDRVLGYLKSQYKITELITPPVGNKSASFESGNVRIFLDAPHMSFQVTAIYTTRDFWREYLKSSTSEKSKKRSEEAGRF
jgi:hypothetical protein